MTVLLSTPSTLVRNVTVLRLPLLLVYIRDGVDDYRKGPTKYRTDRTDRTGGEIAAGKAQINCRDPVINLYTAYCALHNESPHKFY